MATRDLRSYFMSKSKKKKNSHKGIPDLVKATGNVTTADVCAVNGELESFSQKNGRQCSLYSINIPSRENEKVGKYVFSYGTQAAIEHFKSKYPQYIFVRTSINS